MWEMYRRGTRQTRVRKGEMKCQIPLMDGSVSPGSLNGKWIGRAGRGGGPQPLELLPHNIGIN